MSYWRIVVILVLFSFCSVAQAEYAVCGSKFAKYLTEDPFPKFTICESEKCPDLIRIEFSYVIEKSGKTSEVKITKALPNEKYNSVVFDKVSKWRFEPPKERIICKSFAERKN